LDAVSAILTLKALDGLSMRADVTAQNIANAGTPGYRPLRVSFEQALTQAALQGESAVQAVTPMIERDSAAIDQGLRLDLEMATASSTAMRYGALIEVLSRQMQIDALAASGNN